MQMHTPFKQGYTSNALLCSLIISGAVVTGCASTETQSGKTASAKTIAPQQARDNPVDPYEGFNRSMYGFNMGLDKYLLKPVADGYKFVTPNFMQTGVSNFFTNLKGINVVLNDVLQGKFEQSLSDMGRFTTNSTIGVLGLFDIATSLGLENNVEDFGQTLAVWGVEQGPYLVLPILGPTTVRDGTAIVVDKAANPGTYLPGTGIVEGINDRANAEGALNFIDEAALDPYVFTRESFLQYRDNLINDGKSKVENYELDIDAAVDEAIGNNDTSSKNKSQTKQSSKSSKYDIANKPNSNQAFERMSKSFDQAEVQFELASQKMDALGEQKKKRSRHIRKIGTNSSSQTQ